MEVTTEFLVTGVQDREARTVGERTYPASVWVTLTEADGRSFNALLDKEAARPEFGVKVKGVLRVHGNNRQGLSASLLSWEVVMPKSASSTAAQTPAK